MTQSRYVGERVIVVHPLARAAEGDVYAAYPDADDLVAVRVAGREIACGLAQVYPLKEDPDGL